MKETDYHILRHLRQNARQNLTDISRRTHIPVSTLFDRVKQLERNVIRKYASILDFKKLGFTVRATLLIQCRASQREELKKYLLFNEHVNTLIRVNNGYDYFAECIFKDMDTHQEFIDHLAPFHMTLKEYFVLEDLKRETFLSDELNLALVMR
ncbi:MAG TPA: Lrp/AsnC family transcriptional regulator [Candidatus Nanoarchaeia archaeon]|nr:Lrp/AsnC family transcriptional regulator [Candidatus Nanoarchaeia archaeon]